MTLRTKSRGRQWLVWGGLALVALAVAAVWSFLATGSVSAGYFCPSGNRLALPVFALFAYLGWEMRWDGVRRGKRDEGWGMRDEKKSKSEVEVEEKAKARDEGEERRCKGDAQPKGDATLLSREDKADTSSSHAARVPRPLCAMPTKESDHRCPPPPLLSTSSTSSSAGGATGEALYLQARAIPHQKVPDFRSDGPYLKLLGDSSAQGYAPASAKLGEYAMRRAAWVEAYYWMSMAKRQGMQGLANVMREIRKNWSMGDFPNQTSNVNRLFTIEAGSLGRALLHVDSGHEAAKAKEFLKNAHPEFLT